MIQSSPRFSARVRSPATSDPPAGSENNWHQTFSPDASGGRYLRFCSSPANAIMVGPHMPWPMMNTPLSLPKAPSSSCQITRSIGVAPRPPYSLGQCRQAQPASAFFFCQAFATSRRLAPLSSVRPSEAFFKSSSYCLGALATIHAFASARNAASCRVSSKFMRVLSLNTFPGCYAARSDALLIRGPSDRSRLRGTALRAAPRPGHEYSSRRVPFAHPVDQRVFPIGETAEPQGGRVGAAVIHVAVELPGEAHAAMDLDVVLSAMLERLRRADAGRGGRLRQFRGFGRERPGAVIAI